jgi:FkbM family methyltransferase
MHDSLRSLLRRLSRNRVVRKRLPPDLGSGMVYCSPEALLSVWKPGWRSQQAQGLLRWARRFVTPGMTVWDLGANQGIFSLAAAARCGAEGNVVAFEPDLFLVDLMRRSLASGTHAGAAVRLLPMAVGGHNEIAEFQIARTDRALNHLSSAKGNPHAGDAREQLWVPCATLDWLAGQVPVPDLIKIDVEGAEVAALRSGLELLERHAPVLIVETAPENGAEMGRLLAAADYLMFNSEGALAEARTAPAWNTLAWPRRRLAELALLRSRESA